MPNILAVSPTVAGGDLPLKQKTKQKKKCKSAGGTTVSLLGSQRLNAAHPLLETRNVTAIKINKYVKCNVNPM